MIPGIYNGEAMTSPKHRILFMDDEPIIRDVACEMLRYLGYEVVEAPDGETALKLYEQSLETGTRFDLLILDLTIPNGLGAMEIIDRLHSLDSSVRATVSSGWTHDPAIKNPTEYGFCGVIPKPYDIDVMEERIERLLSAQPSS